MIDPEGLDIEAVIYAVIGVVVGVLLAGVLIGVVVRRVDGRHLLVALFVGIVAATALVVDAVVLSRTLSGDVTIWDVCWAIGLTTAAGWSWRLTTPGTAHELLTPGESNHARERDGATALRARDSGR